MRNLLLLEWVGWVIRQYGMEHVSVPPFLLSVPALTRVHTHVYKHTHMHTAYHVI